MVLAELKQTDVDASGPKITWEPTVPRWVEGVSQESQGWQARLLWEEKFAPFIELARESSELLPTGIGGAVAGNVESNGVSVFGDGSIVSPYVDLESYYGSVPKVLFALASTVNSDHLINLISAAIEYKEQGVEVFIPILTAVPHERQDHKFPDERGQIINQFTTLKGAVIALAGAHHRGYIDGAIGIGMHSKRPTELALREDFPLLPFDPFSYMVEKVGLQSIQEPFVVGADKGRKNEAKRLAAILGAPFTTADKSRDRLRYGEPTVIINPLALQYIREHGCNVVTYEDEIREGGTADHTRQELDGFAPAFILVATKGFFAEGTKGSGSKGEIITAAERLSRPLEEGFLEERIIVSNAVEKLTSVDPIADKFEEIDLLPGVQRLVDRLRETLVGGDDPDWMRINGADLHLDLTHEQYE